MEDTGNQIFQFVCEKTIVLRHCRTEIRYLIGL